MHSLSVNGILGLIAGGTIYVGLILAMWRKMPAALKPLLALLSAGILIFLTIEVGYHAFESVETQFRVGAHLVGFINLVLVMIGFALGLIALGFWEDKRWLRKSGSTATPLQIATLTAIGIGVHNFSEGLAIGQTYVGGAVSLGASLVIGFALHNATEGFGIVGSLRGEKISWQRLIILGLIAGGPTVLGSILGGVWSSAYLMTFCYALAAGSLLFVVRELLRIPFSVSSKFALSAVFAGLLLGLGSETIIETAQMSNNQNTTNNSYALLTVGNGGIFSPSNLEINSGTKLKIVNKGDKLYTLEGAGVLAGDVPVQKNGTVTVSTLKEQGSYKICSEENPTLVLPVKIVGSSENVSLHTTSYMADSIATGKQPFIPMEGAEPEYTTYTAFNLTVKGEAERQKFLQELFNISKILSSETLPAELAQYMPTSKWQKLRPSVLMVIGLGPKAFDEVRFGKRVAASKPQDLHEITYSNMLHFDAKKSQCDIIVRLSSDSAWFNQQVCRYIWRIEKDKISDETLDSGYANPNGRSPLIGGFFDGTGNPIGAERDNSVYLDGAQSGGTYMAWFKIGFEQEKFIDYDLQQKQKIIGRQLTSGLQDKQNNPDSHRVHAEGDGKTSILRQGTNYDNGPGKSGIIFTSLQKSITNQFEKILRGSMMQKSSQRGSKGKDSLMNYMHFEAGGYYYIPPVPKNGYPGML